MRIKWLAIGSAYAAFMAAPFAQAAATTEQQKEAAIENLAVIATAKRWCVDYQIDEASTVAVAMSLVDISVEPHTSKFISQKKSAEKMTNDAGTTAVCLATYKIYGPTGMGIMIKR